MRNQSDIDTPLASNSHLIAHRTYAALPAILHVSLLCWLDFYLFIFTKISFAIEKKGLWISHYFLTKVPTESF